MGVGDWPLVGREEVCDAIRVALTARPRTSIVLAGPPGVGRTRLAREALSLAARSGRPTRWAAGSEPATAVPFGALAHLLPAVGSGSDPLPLLQQAAAAITGMGPEPVLVVDDVHLLDHLSLCLLHQLAAGAAVSLVLTVRSEPTLTDPTTPLWKDDLAVRTELFPLDGAQTAHLLATVLGGDVEMRTADRLWRLTGGVPRYLRETIDDGLRTGRLSDSGALWRWNGRMVAPPRLAELVLAQIGKLSAAERRAMGVLATAESVSVEQLIALSSARAVAALEHRGLVRDDGPGNPGGLRAAHPMIAAVVRSRVSEATQRRVRELLVVGEARPDSGHALDRRWAVLLDGHRGSADPAALTEAAAQALVVPDLPLAERLAQAAVDAGAGPEAALLLIEATRWRGDPARSDRMGAGVALPAGADSERAALASARAVTLACGLGRFAEAESVLRAEAARAVTDPDRHVLGATEAVLAYVHADPRKVVRLASDLAAHGYAQPLAAAAIAVGSAAAGRTGRALTAVAEGRRSFRPTLRAGETLLARLLLDHAEVVALHLAGRIEELVQRTARIHRAALAAPEWAGDAVASLHCGWAALAHGQARSAVRWLVDAEAGLGRQDPLGMRDVATALLTIARALLGRLPLGPPGGVGQDGVGPSPAFQPIVALGRAYALAAAGRTADAGRTILEAAALARAQEQPGVAALALHHAVRFGLATEVAGPLRDLAAVTEAPLVGDFAVHAEAVVRADAAQLDEVSGRFQRAGALLLAADAALEAAAVYERAGARRSAGESRIRAMALARECGVVGAAAVDLVALPNLTSREEEVAFLAGRGLTNQDIAERLVVSVRTVEAHLSHVYAKFGITRRTDLLAALDIGTDRPADVPVPRSESAMEEPDVAAHRPGWS